MGPHIICAEELIFISSLEQKYALTSTADATFDKESAIAEESVLDDILQLKHIVVHDDASQIAEEAVLENNSDSSSSVDTTEESVLGQYLAKTSISSTHYVASNFRAHERQQQQSNVGIVFLFVNVNSLRRFHSLILLLSTLPTRFQDTLQLFKLVVHDTR